MRIMTYAEEAYPHVMVDISTTPLDLIILLHDGAIESLQKTILYINKGDVNGKTEYSSKAMAIIEEILTSLDLKYGGDIAFHLQWVYTYLLKELAIANIKNNTEMVRNIQEIIRELKKAWRQIQ